MVTNYTKTVPNVPIKKGCKTLVENEPSLTKKIVKNVLPQGASILDKERVTIVNGSGKNRDVYKLGDVEIEDDIRSTIIGLRAFTGYVFFIIII